MAQRTRGRCSQYPMCQADQTITLDKAPVKFVPLKEPHIGQQVDDPVCGWLGHPRQSTISDIVVGRGFSETTSNIEKAFPVTPSSANCSLRSASAGLAGRNPLAVDLPTTVNFLCAWSHDPDPCLDGGAQDPVSCLHYTAIKMISIVLHIGTMQISLIRQIKNCLVKMRLFVLNDETKPC